MVLHSRELLSETMFFDDFRTPGRTQLMRVKSGQIFGKLLSASILLIFFGPAGGQCTLTGAWHAKGNLDMACGDGRHYFITMHRGKIAQQTLTKKMG